MDFGERLPRKTGMGQDGHYDWEKPHLRQRIDEGRKAVKPQTVNKVGEALAAGITWEDSDMLKRDYPSMANDPFFPLGCFEVVEGVVVFRHHQQATKPAAESGCEPQATSGLWYPKDEPDFGPWIDGEVPPGASGRGQILYREEQQDRVFEPCTAKLTNFVGWTKVVAYRREVE